MTLDQVRKFALSLPQVKEQPHFDYTSFRVRSKIFATAPPAGGYLHIFVGDEDRVTALSQGFNFLEELHWGKKVCGLRVFLSKAEPPVVQKLLVEAWKRKAPKLLLKQSPKVA